MSEQKGMDKLGKLSKVAMLNNVYKASKASKMGQMGRIVQEINRCNIITGFLSLIRRLLFKCLIRSRYPMGNLKSLKIRKNVLSINQRRNKWLP